MEKNNGVDPANHGKANWGVVWFRILLRKKIARKRAEKAEQLADDCRKLFLPFI